MTKLIQTYYSFANKDIFQNDGGFLCPEIHYMAWALSCIQLKKFHKEVELYTTNEGKQLFEYLEIPYSLIHTDLNNSAFLNTCMPELWAYSKIYTYSIQTEPFIHIDGDILIFKPFKESYLNDDLIAQNIEINGEVYQEMISKLEDLEYSKPWFLYIKDHNLAYNTGLFGGSNLQFIKEYTEEAFNFYFENEFFLKKLLAKDKNINGINVIFEQSLYYALSTLKNKKVQQFTEHQIINNIGYSYFFNITNGDFVHLMGTSKKNILINQFIFHSLKKCAPETFYKILDFYAKNNGFSDFMQHLLQLDLNKTKPVYDIFSKRIVTKSYLDVIISNESKTFDDFIQFINEKNNKKILFTEEIKEDVYRTENIFKNLIPKVNSSLCCNNYFNYPLNKSFSDWMNTYIYANPNCRIFAPKYNWFELDLLTAKDICLINNTVFLCFYLDFNSNIFQCSVLKKQFCSILRIISKKAIKIKNLAKILCFNEKECQQFIIDMQECWKNGLIYFSDKMENIYVDDIFSDRSILILNNYENQVNNLMQNLNPILKNISDNLKQYDYNSPKFINSILHKYNFVTRIVKTNNGKIRDLPTMSLIRLNYYGDFVYFLFKKLIGNKVIVFNPLIGTDEVYEESLLMNKWTKIAIIINEKK